LTSEVHLYVYFSIFNDIKELERKLQLHHTDFKRNICSLHTEWLWTMLYCNC